MPKRRQRFQAAVFQGREGIALWRDDVEPEIEVIHIGLQFFQLALRPVYLESLNGSSLSSALLAALVASDAGFGFSVSAAIAWVATAIAATKEHMTLPF